GASNVSIHLETGGRISGTLVDDVSGTGTWARYAILRGNECVATGSAEASLDRGGLPCGVYTVLAYRYDGKVALQTGIDVAPGMRSDVGLRLAVGARLRVTYEGRGRAGRLLIKTEGATIQNRQVTAGDSIVSPVPAGRTTVELHIDGAIKAS